MPGNALVAGAAILCPHGGVVSIVDRSARIMAGGMGLVTLDDPSVVAGCPNMVGEIARPCIAARWLTAATRVLIDGRPPVLEASAGMTVAADGIPAGAPVIVANPSRVNMV